VHSAAAADGKPTASSGVDSEAKSPKVKILVVDDQMAVTTMIRFLLTRAGCETQGALNAEKALRLARTEVFDLITLDVELPGANGFVIYQRLREIPHVKDTPICFVSGRPTMENIQHAFELGAADFIEKPFDTQDFLSRILSLVEKTATA
jgi:DNA-binding response OmpR family regulator